MEKLNMYQVCYISGDGKGRTATASRVISASTLMDAYAAVMETDSGKDFLVYPLATAGDGDSIYNLADYACKQFHKWEVRNNNAVLAVLNRSVWDREDERQDAAAAITAALAENDSATMFDAFRAAYNALAAGRDGLFRKSEVEYTPGAMFCNPFVTRRVKATFPRLAALIARATDAAGLTEKQAETLEMYESGTTCAAALALLSVTKRSYYQNLYAAFFKVLSKAVEFDGVNVPTFESAGISKEDVQAALDVYAKRARVRR